MNGWLVDADFISAGLGLAGSIVLGVPAIKAIRAKRYYEDASRLRARNNEHEQHRSDLENLTRRVEALQLAGARDALVWNLAGYVLLTLSFVFLGIAAIERAT